MKLYLSSYRVPTPKGLWELAGQKPAEITVGIIPNAKDYYDDVTRSLKIAETRAYFGELGVRTSVVDLRDHSQAMSERLTRELLGYQVLWAMGGNSFILRHQMRRSGFESVIREVLSAGVVYGGESAGAIVAGGTLRGIEHADNPELAEEYIDTGLRLLPHLLLPHIGSPDFAEPIEKIKQLHAGGDIIELTDSQAVLVSGSKVWVVTST